MAKKATSKFDKIQVCKIFQGLSSPDPQTGWLTCFAKNDKPLPNPYFAFCTYKMETDCKGHKEK